MPKGQADTPDLQKAKSFAFRLLKIRQRSERELIDRLQRKKIPQETIDRTLQYLRNYQFVGDREFTKWWVRSRLNKPFGLKRIREELKDKGIAEELIRSELSCIQPELDESQMIGHLLAKRLNRYRGLDPIKRKRRIFEFLCRRGFSLEAVEQAIKNL